MRISAYVSLALLLTLTLSCASKKTPSSSTQKEGAAKAGHSWDYDRIREMRQAEAAQTPSSETQQKWAEADANCTILTEAQMIRSKAQGCRPVDPQAGVGESSFCCPKK